MTLLIDVAPIGPDYIPAHAHADSLSYEFSMCEQRIVVNSGVSHYQKGEARDFQRGTAAHSTIEIDCKNSSEIWDSFRVARRAKVYKVSLDENNRIVITAEHDGYLRLKKQCIHKRTWLLIRDRWKSQMKYTVGFQVLCPVTIYIRRLKSFRLQQKIKLNELIVESSTHILTWYYGVGFQNLAYQFLIPAGNEVWCRLPRAKVPNKV